MGLFNNSSPGVRRRKPLIIDWITDVHIKSSSTDNPESNGAIVTVKYMYTAEDKMKNFVDLVNTDKPNMVLCTGDLVDAYVEDFPVFMNYWNSINVDKKYLTVGNHDMSFVTTPEAESALGVSARTSIAGSKFNYAFSITGGDASVRVLMLDTTNGVHEYAGRCTAEMQSWIQTELANCSEKIVLICMHHPVYQYAVVPPQFDETEALQLKAIVENAVLTRGLTVYGLCGHQHGLTTLWNTESLGASFLGLVNTCAVDLESSYYNRLKIFKNGAITVTPVKISYPYPV